MQKIVTDLGANGYLTVERVGRRNRYRVQVRMPLRHPLERNHRIGELLDLLQDPQSHGVDGPAKR